MVNARKVVLSFVVVGSVFCATARAETWNPPAVLVPGTYDHHDDVVELSDGADLHLEAGTGTSAKIVILARRLVVGHRVRIEGLGKPGVNGADAPARTDTLVVATHGDWSVAGSAVDAGLRGADGSPGGSGPSLTIRAETIDPPTFKQRITVELAGGAGGHGGKGGRGRMLLCGQDPGEEPRYGPTGPDGGPGARGPSGEVTVERVTFAPDGSVVATQGGSFHFARAVPVSLTVNGGISMGAYEAGFNWALIRYLKSHRYLPGTESAGAQYRLDAITGASAGSINTILSAIEWLQLESEDDGESPTDNVFYQVWIPIGIPALLPDKPGEYATSDGLLAKGAFKHAADLLSQKLDSGRFRPSQSVNVGFTVTRLTPRLLNVSGGAPQRGDHAGYPAGSAPGDVVIPVDRASVVATAIVSESGRLAFFDRGKRSQDVGDYLDLAPATIEDGHPSWEARIDTDRLISAIRASSSFPIAFSWEQVDYFDPSKDPARTHARFFDGGVFDNEPIGLARSLLDSANGARGIVVDPLARRGDAQTRAFAPAGGEVGLGRIPTIAENFVSVSRKYEIQALARFLSPEMSITTSTRYFPIFGDRLQGFGAFVLQSFRHYDYAVGVYDALVTSATLDCGGKLTFKDPGFDFECFVPDFLAQFNRLHLDSDESGLGGVVRRLLRDELIDALGERQAEAALNRGRLADGRDAWTYCSADIGSPLMARYVDFNESVLKRTDAQRRSAHDFSDLVAVIKAAHADPAVKKSNEVTTRFAEDAPALESPTKWVDARVATALDRELTVERRDGSKMGIFGVRAGEFLWRTHMRSTEGGFDVDGSTLPARAGIGYRFIPEFIAGSREYATVGWEPTLGFVTYDRGASWWSRASSRLGLVMPVAASYQLNPGFSNTAGAHISLCATSRFNGWIIPDLEIGPRVSMRWSVNLARSHAPDYDQPSGSPTVGGEATLRVLKGKLRLTLSFDDARSRRFHLVTGVADLSGLVYWFAGSH